MVARGLLFLIVVSESKTVRTPPSIREKSVFEVDDSRLAIGVFSRPLLDVEAHSFQQAWARDPMPGFAEFELGRERISFVTPPENVSIAWKAIDRFLACATDNVRRVS
jgi:hypothetical protein